MHRRRCRRNLPDAPSIESRLRLHRLQAVRRAVVGVRRRQKHDARAGARCRNRDGQRQVQRRSCGRESFRRRGPDQGVLLEGDSTFDLLVPCPSRDASESSSRWATSIPVEAAPLCTSRPRTSASRTGRTTPRSWASPRGERPGSISTGAGTSRYAPSRAHGTTSGSGARSRAHVKVIA